MRVLLIATKYFGLGGIEAYSRMLARAVAAEGADVDVLSLLDGESSDRSCPGRYLGHQGSRSTLWAQGRFAAQALRYGRGYDLVICGHVAVAPLGLMLSRLFGIPYLVIGYGIDVWDPLSPKTRAALQQAAHVVVLSHFTAQMVVALHGISRERISVIHPAVDPSLMAHADFMATEAARGDGTVTLLTVARLSTHERYKGCDTVISALPAVASDASPVRYVIVGDGDDLPRLVALAHDRGVAALVTFIGPAEGAVLAARYRACDIFVMPSVAERRPGGWAGEGFGIVYIEAAAFGRPVIAGQGGGAPEAVQNGITGLVVDGKDVSAVAGALIRLVRDAGLRARMGEAGRRWIQERFTFTRFRKEVGVVVGAAVGQTRRFSRHGGGVANNQRL